MWTLQKLPIPYYRDEYVTLYHGDCREIIYSLESDLQLSLITDPPYGISLSPPRKKTRGIINDSEKEAKALLYAIMPALAEILPLDSTHMVFSGWNTWWIPMLLTEWFTIKSAIVWDKEQFGIGYYTRPQYEIIYNLHRGSPAAPVNAVSDIWREMRVMSPEHSCEKPIKLMQRIIQFIDANAVLDPFAGSGATLIAAKNLARPCIGIEIEEEYCEIIVQRLQQEVLPLRV